MSTANFLVVYGSSETFRCIFTTMKMAAVMHGLFLSGVQIVEKRIS